MPDRLARADQKVVAEPTFKPRRLPRLAVSLGCRRCGGRPRASSAKARLDRVFSGRMSNAVSNVAMLENSDVGRVCRVSVGSPGSARTRVLHGCAVGGRLG